RLNAYTIPGWLAMTSTRRGPPFAICSGSTTSPLLRSVEDDPPAEGRVERREMAARGQGRFAVRSWDGPARGGGHISPIPGRPQAPSALARDYYGAWVLRVLFDSGACMARMNFRSKRMVVVGATALAGVGGGGAAVAATSSNSRGSDFLDSVAKHLGVSPQKLEDATKAAAIDQVNADLAAGRITQAQADELKKRIEAGNGVL